LKVLIVNIGYPGVRCNIDLKINQAN